MPGFPPITPRLSAVLLALAGAAAQAAPWSPYVTLPSGDEVLLSKQGRATLPAGSRAEVDVPVRLRFANPVTSPVGPVPMAEAKLRVICKDGSVSVAAVQPRTAEGKAFAAKDRKAAAAAVSGALKQALSAPAFVDKLCRR